MRMTLTCLALLTPFLAGAPAPTKKTNLLVNGGFEEGPAFEKFQSYNAGSSAIKGWVVTRAEIDVVDNYWPAAQGKRSIDLHGSPGLGGIQQKFRTRRGSSYVVSFAFAGNPEGSVPVKSMGVSAGKQSAEFTFDTTGKNRFNLGWVKKTWRFTAVDTETTLEFYTVMTNDDSCGPIIDDVSVMEAD